MFANIIKVVRTAAVITSVLASGIAVVGFAGGLFRGLWNGWPAPSLGFAGVKGLFTSAG